MYEVQTFSSIEYEIYLCLKERLVTENTEKLNRMTVKRYNTIQIQVIGEILNVYIKKNYTVRMLQ